MLKKGLIFAVSCLSFLSSANVQAQDVNMRYSALYGKLKNNLKEGHDDVKIRLYLVDKAGQTCHVHKASMRKDEHYEELTIPADYALSIPLDSNLRQANPDVTFIIDDGITCDVSMQILAENYQPKVLEQAYIEAIVPQMNTMMADLGGMFSQWFMPKAEGVVITLKDRTFNKTLALKTGKTLNFNSGVARVHLNDLAENESINLSKEIEKISPWIPTKS
ncbi:DUF2987 domain-containing protein [Photobacterium leiognathi]|uniref:DUF2987 domain-containing protein n=1 Tax=Photobacterium leiognathi TaxID=553611 RepID=UPI002981A31A|nr:DUF2987 domain-containing protein [Photobacterium leiognathi]